MIIRKLAAIIGARLQYRIAGLTCIAVGQYVVVGKDEGLPVFLYQTTQSACRNIAVPDADPPGAGRYLAVWD